MYDPTRRRFLAGLLGVFGIGSAGKLVSEELDKRATKTARANDIEVISWTRCYGPEVKHDGTAVYVGKGTVCFNRGDFNDVNDYYKMMNMVSVSFFPLKSNYKRLYIVYGFHKELYGMRLPRVTWEMMDEEIHPCKLS